MVVQRTKEFESRRPCSIPTRTPARLRRLGRSDARERLPTCAPTSERGRSLDRIAQDRSVAGHQSRVFRLFTAPMEIRRLESQIEGAQATFGFQSMRLKAREEERSPHLRKQVENLHHPGPA